MSGRHPYYSRAEGVGGGTNDRRIRRALELAGISDDGGFLDPGLEQGFVGIETDDSGSSFPIEPVDNGIGILAPRHREFTSGTEGVFAGLAGFSDGEILSLTGILIEEERAGITTVVEDADKIGAGKPEIDPLELMRTRLYRAAGSDSITHRPALGKNTDLGLSEGPKNPSGATATLSPRFSSDPYPVVLGVDRDGRTDHITLDGQVIPRGVRLLIIAGSDASSGPKAGLDSPPEYTEQGLTSDALDLPEGDGARVSKRTREAARPVRAYVQDVTGTSDDSYSGPLEQAQPTDGRSPVIPPAPSRRTGRVRTNHANAGAHQVISPEDQLNLYNVLKVSGSRTLTSEAPDDDRSGEVKREPIPPEILWLKTHFRGGLGSILIIPDSESQANGSFTVPDKNDVNIVPAVSGECSGALSNYHKGLIVRRTSKLPPQIIPPHVAKKLGLRVMKGGAPLRPLSFERSRAGKDTRLKVAFAIASGALLTALAAAGVYKLLEPNNPNSNPPSASTDENDN